MAENKFKFVSPGVEISEIDNSQYDATPEDVGYLIIGRARRGPAMRPVKVRSYAEFIEMFGESLPDASNNIDVWRESVQLGPTYGTYAAQAALKNKNSLTYVRLLGTQHVDYQVGSGEAGWKAGSYSAVDWSGGSYGLFVWPSGSSNNITGTLAAIWYCTTGSVNLSGTIRGNSNLPIVGNGVLIDSNVSKEFVVDIRDTYQSTVERVKFNFNPTSDRFIRKVFNTNPSLTNGSVFSSTSSYWLGESFEDFLNDSEEIGNSLANASVWHGAIFALGDGTNYGNNFQRPMTNSQTGWFFRQNFGADNESFVYDNMTKLFKFHALDSGEWTQSHIKISIANIKQSKSDQFDPYGTFDVVVRQINDTDGSIVVLETFANCNLNPASDNYISKKIGDKYISFNSSTRRNVEYGQFDNRSKFIRVEVSSEVENQTITKESLPFGVYGPIAYKGFTLLSGSTTFFSGSTAAHLQADQASSYRPFVMAGTGTIDFYNPAGAAATFNPGGGNVAESMVTASFVFPSTRLRISTTSGTLSSPKDAFFGLYTSDSSNTFSPSVKDLTRILPSGLTIATPDANTDYQWVFTLDDVRWLKQSGVQGYNAVYSSVDAEWVSGSHLTGTAISVSGTNTWTDVLDAGFNSFTTVMFGGFDGIDITEVEPFNNTDLDGSSEKTSYAYNSIKQAIDIVSDPEEITFSDFFMPGIYEDTLTSHALRMCENRADAMAVLDIENDYTPRPESTATEANRIGTPTSAVNSMNSRGINSSYGAAYYPWVQMRDTISGNLVWVPPSVVAAGVFAKTDRDGGPWWAPAGMTRGGVSGGNIGVSVINVRQRLTKKQRDDLYDANINPIASFPQQGIVVWGQKTLQVTKSALDRINVRRMILYIKRKLSQIALQTAFEFNDNVTWERFKGKADIFLSQIFSDRGIAEYKLVLDETTTTNDLKDRNIMYAKLFIKPTKVAEFIAIDLAITNQGASFADF